VERSGLEAVVTAADFDLAGEPLTTWANQGEGAGEPTPQVSVSVQPVLKTRVGQRAAELGGVDMLDSTRSQVRNSCHPPTEKQRG
jgi:hypothetical protein